LSRRKLLSHGYVYLKSKSEKNKTYWECRRLPKKECRAQAITSLRNDELIVLKKTEHSHPPNQEEVKAAEVKARVKDIARQNPQLPPAHILRNELPKVPSGVLVELPERENLKKSMRRVRRKDLLPNPKSLEELEGIPDRFQKTIAGNFFYF